MGRWMNGLVAEWLAEWMTGWVAVPTVRSVTPINSDRPTDQIVALFLSTDKLVWNKCQD